MHRHGGQAEGGAHDTQADRQRQQRLRRAARRLGFETGGDRAQIGRATDSIEADEGVEEDRRSDERQEEILQARLLTAGVGPLEAEQDVGGDRDKLEAREQQHEIPRHADERKAGEHHEKRAGLLAGAATVQPRATARGGGEDVARLHQREQGSDGQHRPADENREPIDRDPTGGDHLSIGRLAAGHRHRRGDARQGHEPAVPDAREPAAEVGDEGRDHEHDLGGNERKGLE